MQCKDIPDEPILLHLAVHGGIGCTLWPVEDIGEEAYARSALRAMPEAVPWKLANAKMVMLMRRGLVDGCPCGCRGDWELTDKGRAELARKPIMLDGKMRSLAETAEYLAKTAQGYVDPEVQALIKAEAERMRAAQGAG